MRGIIGTIGATLAVIAALATTATAQAGDQGRTSYIEQENLHRIGEVFTSFVPWAQASDKFVALSSPAGGEVLGSDS